MEILVIRLGALGDVVLSFGAFAAIRAHHPRERVTLLTTLPFASFLSLAPWFDAVRVDLRPAWWDLPGLVQLARQLRGFDRVYDLQTSSRSSRYHRLAGRPAWSGIAPGCSLPHADPGRNAMHTIERQRGQLRSAGVDAFPDADLGWLIAAAPSLPPDPAILVPGASPHRPRKRWPVERFAELATLLRSRGKTPVVVGSAAERPLGATIRRACPDTLDLTGATDLAALAGILSRGALAVGNDTGPMHLAAALGCPTLTLFSGDSDPALTAPRGPGGTWPPVLRVSDLASLPLDRVAASLPAAR